MFQKKITVSYDEQDSGMVHRCSFLAPVVTYYSVHGLKKSVSVETDHRGSTCSRQQMLKSKNDSSLFVFLQISIIIISRQLFVKLINALWPFRCTCSHTHTHACMHHTHTCTHTHTHTHTYTHAHTLEIYKFTQKCKTSKELYLFESLHFSDMCILISFL